MKKARFVGSSRKDLKEFPERIRQVFGQAIYNAQNGEKHPAVKVLKGFGGAGVLEAIENYQGDAYRAVYTVRFAEFVYVLHVFKKKSKRGIETPKHDIDLIRYRLKIAQEDYENEKQRQENTSEH